MGWASREAWTEWRHRKALLRERTETIVALVFAAAPRWGSTSIKEDLAEEAARIADGDTAVLGEIFYHPRVKKARETLKRGQPLLGRSKFSNHQLGMLLFVTGFHASAQVEAAFERYESIPPPPVESHRRLHDDSV